jgi:hypothetical protein
MSALGAEWPKCTIRFAPCANARNNFRPEHESPFGDLATPFQRIQAVERESMTVTEPDIPLTRADGLRLLGAQSQAA